MTYLTRLTQAYAKAEIEYGTSIFSSPPVEADAVWCSNITFGSEGEPNDANQYRASFTKAPGGGSSAVRSTLTMEMPLKGSGTNTASNTDPPAFNDLLLACGMSYASQVYSPDSDSTASCTVYVYIGTKLIKITGWRGTFSINAVAGQNATITFTGSGLFSLPLDSGDGGYQAQPSSVTDSEALPAVLKAANCTFGGLAAGNVKFRNYTFEWGADAQPYLNANATDALESINIVDRNCTATLDPEMVATSALDMWAAWQAGTETTLAITIGTVTDGKFTISGNTQYTAMPLADDGGNMVHGGLPFRYVDGDDDNEVTITIS